MHENGTPLSLTVRQSKGVKDQGDRNIFSFQTDFVLLLLNFALLLKIILTRLKSNSVLDRESTLLFLQHLQDLQNLMRLSRLFAINKSEFCKVPFPAFFPMQFQSYFRSFIKDQHLNFLKKCDFYEFWSLKFDIRLWIEYSTIFCSKGVHNGVNIQ